MTALSTKTNHTTKMSDVPVAAIPSQKAAGAFRTISEVGDELNVPQHVLRFWETKFFQVRPVKRSGGRRYYRPEDVALLKHIHHLLYAEGYTIRGVQKLLKGVSKSSLMKEAGSSADAMHAAAAGDVTAANSDARIQEIVSNLDVAIAGSVDRDADLSKQSASLAPAGLTVDQRATLTAALIELKTLRDML